ncbi:hypothetical protein Hbl1158_03040 [Halobaculum sp. CBA1158]|uniref:DUF7266 family protein n=1 Tax=Halobaculum sp. CBA1158 TaxID=2904243 RepID=UPI001F2EA1AC|nr:hypothetical protein [Halobaculum sp. CBA1158]UIP00361.1 hypothetical protein Hbl1158_03040 [Halobaculum sp. CBA1158]
MTAECGAAADGGADRGVATDRTVVVERGRDRAATPIVAKTLEIGLVLLFVAGLSAALFGGVVPDYRDAAGDRLADRTLAGAATDVERAVPPPAATVRVERRVRLPDTIRGAAYRVVADGDGLRLVHPNPAIGGNVRLALPDRVATVTGAWESGMTTAVVVEGGSGVGAGGPEAGDGDGSLAIELVSR